MWAQLLGIYDIHMHRKRLLSRVFVLFCFLIKLIYCLIDSCFLVQMTRGHLWKSWDIFMQGNGYRYYALSVAKRMFSHVLYEGVQTNKIKKKHSSIGITWQRHKLQWNKKEQWQRRGWTFFPLLFLFFDAMCSINYMYVDIKTIHVLSSRTTDTTGTYKYTHAHANTHTHTPQTSRVLISLSLLLTVTVPVLRRVSGCVDWKQAAVTQYKALSTKP